MPYLGHNGVFFLIISKAVSAVWMSSTDFVRRKCNMWVSTLKGDNSMKVPLFGSRPGNHNTSVPVTSEEFLVYLQLISNQSKWH